jgi:osmotically-inducible protein OsmY
MEKHMPQNYRHPRESWRSDQAAGYARDGRYRGGSERDRYQSGDEQRYQSDQQRTARGPGDRGFSGDRSYAGSGYAEENGYRGPGEGRSQNRWQSGQAGAAAWRDDESRSAGDRDYWERQAGRDQSERDESYRDAYNQAEDTFHGRPGDERDYGARSFFGTGNYAGVDEYAPISRMRGGGFYAEGDRHHEHAPSESNFRRGAAPFNYGRDYAGRDHSTQDSWRSNQSSAGSFGYGSNDYHTSGTSHTGRGPKGYERSDERLREIICERLTDDPWIDASDVTIEVANKTVKLSGTVNNRQTKYEIEELIERTTNVREIDNQLKVQAPQGQGQGSSRSDQATNTSRTNAPQSGSQASGLSSAGVTSGGSSTAPAGSTRKN